MIELEEIFLSLFECLGKDSYIRMLYFVTRGIIRQKKCCHQKKTRILLLGARNSKLGPWLFSFTSGDL